jgi:hypothetical protein
MISEVGANYFNLKRFGPFNPSHPISYDREDGLGPLGWANASVARSKRCIAVSIAGLLRMHPALIGVTILRRLAPILCGRRSCGWTTILMT